MSVSTDAPPADEPPVPLTAARNLGFPRQGLRALLVAVQVAAGVAIGVFGARYFASAPEAVTTPLSTPHSDEGEVEFPADKQLAAGVVVQSVTAAPLVSRTWRPGRVAVHEDRLAHVCPTAEGVVREVPARLGQRVLAGEVLAVLDSRELGQAKLDAYKARIAAAAEREMAARTRTTMANAEELLTLLAAGTPLAEVERRLADKPIGDWRQQLLGAYVRSNQLKAQSASQRASTGVVAESTLRKTEAEAEAAGAAYTSLFEELRFQVKNQVRQAEVKLKEAETAYDVARAKLLLFGLTPAAVDALDPLAEGAAVSHLAVKAPFAGTVVEKHAVRSERVGPQTQMFVIADLSRVWVEADVFEADLPLVRGSAGRTVAFRSTLADVPAGEATVVYAGDLIDKSSRSLTVTAETANADGRLKPGMFVEVGFDTGDQTAVIQVPAAAVLRHENRPFVFVQTTADRFRRAEVVLGRTAGDQVAVTDGLNAGDRVVVAGGFVLKSELLKDQMAGE